jgi:EmrB/QacA subfamily drug resistance transporter
MTAQSSMASARRWTLTATIIGSSLTFIDATAINVALPALQTHLHATMTDVQWVIEAYALFLGSLILVGGSLGDQIGRKRVFVIGVWVFTLASVACGLAASAPALIVARAVQGVGAACLVPSSLAIISAAFDDAERGRAIGTWSGFSAITSAIGPIAGGWLIEHISWRAVFFLNVPLAAIVLVISARHISESRDASRNFRIDWAGGLLAVFGLGAVVLALLEWPRQVERRPFLGATMALGASLLMAFIVVESRVSSPMLSLRLFASRRFTLANLLTLLQYGALATVFWLVPLNLIQVQHYSATGAGAALLPLPVLMFALSRWSGGLVSHVGSRLPLTVGPIVAAAGLALFARTGIGGTYWTTFFPAVALLGFGMAILVAPLTTAAMTAVETQHAGVASGVNNAVARVAGLIAIAVFGIVLIRTFEVRVGAALGRLAVPPSARSSVDREIPKLAGAEVAATVEPALARAIRRTIDESFVSSFGLIMIAAAGSSLAAAACGALFDNGPTRSAVSRQKSGPSGQNL